MPRRAWRSSICCSGLQRERGVAFLYITHDIASARHFADRIAVMHLGSIVETGTARQVIDNPVHPYTRALIAAVPEPDPANRFRRRATERWQDTPGLAIHPECPHGGSIAAPAVLLEVSGEPGQSSPATWSRPGGADPATRGPGALRCRSEP